MKRLLLLMLLLITAFQGFSQTRGISYQAVILSPNAQEIPGANAQGNILANSAVSIQFTIVNASGSEEFREYHKTNTDRYGMINLLIGNGTPTSSNDFSDIFWDGTTKKLKVGIDFSGGINFSPLSEQNLSYMPQPASIETAQIINENADKIVEESTRAVAAEQANSAAISLKEDAANKSTDATLATNSDVLFPTVKAVKTYVDAQSTSGITGLDAEIERATAAEGVIQADVDANQTAREAADATLTANLTTEIINRTNADSLKEALANKSIDVTTDEASDTKYPSVKAVKTYVVASIATATPDATTTVKGKIQLAGDLTGTAVSPLIGDSKVTTLKIADAAVTDAKIANGISASKVGLGNVDNTADIDKPISALTQNAITAEVTRAGLAEVANANDITTIKGEQTTQNDAIALNTAKKGISSAQESAIALNTLKVSDINHVALSTTDDLTEGSTNKYYTDARVSANSAVVVNTNKVGITSGQTAAILANTNDVTSIKAEQLTQNTAVSANFDAIALKEDKATKNVANGYAGLDINTKIDVSQLPAITMNNIFTVTSEANQLALSVSQGDVAIRTDISTNYINNSGANATMADWSELASPGVSVTSVNGKTGNVVIGISDIATLQTKLNEKMDVASLSAIATSGSYSDLNGVPANIDLNYTDDLLITDLVNDLTSGGTNKALTAEQGKILKGLVNVNTAKAGITPTQAAAIVANTAKISDINHVTSSTTTDLAEGSNLYYTETRVSANANVLANTAKTGISTTQATAISANTNDLITIKTEQTTQNSAILANSTALGLKEDKATKNEANGYAGLDVNKKIDVSQLPAITMNNIFTVTSESEQIALTVNQGDVAIRTDISKNYINNSGANASMADWSELASAGVSVSSVNGKTGNVVLSIADIATLQSTLDAKMEATNLATVATSGSYNDLSNVPANLDTDKTDDLLISDLIDNLISGGSTKVLTAEQGKILKGLVDVNTNKTGITTQQANDIIANNAKISDVNHVTSSTTDDLTEGSTNLYYTEARVAANAAVASSTTHTSLTNNPHSVTKTQVGLENVDNTSDANKPVSTAAQTALNLKANLASPTFTGTPTLPTGTIGITQTALDNSTALATTAYVDGANSTNANLTGPITSSGNTTSIASQTGTGSKFVMDTAPTLVTPVLGDATATTVNKLTITTPATSATLTLADGSTFATAGAFSQTLTATAATDVTLPTTGTLATRSGTEAFTNKTIDADFNNVVNISNVNIKAGAAIDAAKLADGSVSNTEYQYLDGVTSKVQTQLTNNATNISTNTTAIGSLNTAVTTNATAISGKLTANSPITGATKTKITFGANGLVTAGVDATTADIAASTDKNYVTDAMLTDLQNLATSTSNLVSTGTNYTVLTTDKYVICSAGITVSLPTATGIAGKEYIIKNMSSTTVTVQANGTQQILEDSGTSGNTTTIGVEANNNWIKLVSDGSSWITFRALY